jgi:hypothetical protein
MELAPTDRKKRMLSSMIEKTTFAEDTEYDCYARDGG